MLNNRRVFINPGIIISNSQATRQEALSKLEQMLAVASAFDRPEVGALDTMEDPVVSVIPYDLAAISHRSSAVNLVIISAGNNVVVGFA